MKILLDSVTQAYLFICPRQTDKLAEWFNRTIKHILQKMHAVAMKCYTPSCSLMTPSPHHKIVEHGVQEGQEEHLLLTWHSWDHIQWGSMIPRVDKFHVWVCQIIGDQFHPLLLYAIVGGGSRSEFKMPPFPKTMARWHTLLSAVWYGALFPEYFCIFRSVLVFCFQSSCPLFPIRDFASLTLCPCVFGFCSCFLLDFLCPLTSTPLFLHPALSGCIQVRAAVH